VGDIELRAEIARLNAVLKLERARRQLAEQAVRSLQEEIDKTRDFLDSLPEFGCTMDTTVAVIEFLLETPNVAGPRKPG
jgi:hypothetical protein